MATRHVVPIAPRPLSLEKKSHVRTVRAIAWAPCNAARSSQFRDVYGDYSEADILAALTAVELFGRSGARALTGIRVEEPRLHDDEIAAFVKPEKFHGIYTGSSDTSEDGYHGSMEIEFNADPEGWTIDPASFSVVVEDGKVTAIVTSRLYSTVEY